MDYMMKYRIRHAISTLKKYIVYNIFAAIIGVAVVFIIEKIALGDEAWTVFSSSRIFEIVFRCCATFTVLYTLVRILSGGFLVILLLLGALIILQSAIFPVTGIKILSLGSQEADMVVFGAVFWLYYFVFCCGFPIDKD